MKKRLLLLTFLVCSSIVFAQDIYTISPTSKLTIEGTSTANDWTVTVNKMRGTGAAMDKKMHAALKKDEYSKVSFELERIKNTSTLIGNLIIAGQERSVEMDIETAFGVNEIKISGAKKIILQDFRIEPPSAMFGQIIVGDDVTVKFDLIYQKD